MLKNSKGNHVLNKSRLVAPTEFSADADSDTQITVTWTDVEEVGTVQFERSLDEGGPFEIVGEVDVGDEVFVDDGLEPETEYFYRARAWYLPHGYSDYTDVDSDTTAASE